MEQLKKQEEILSLGKTIIKQLRYNDKSSHNSLSILEEWMAQYIAELIKEIEDCSDPLKKKDLEKECSNTILQLWNKRYSWPDDVKPFSGLKKILDFTEIIEEESLIDRLFGNHKEFKEPWIDIANKTVESSRNIIKLCFFASLIDSRLLDDKIWFDNHRDLLTKDEIDSFNSLDLYINDIDWSSKFLNYSLDDDNDIEVKGSAVFMDRKSSIIKTIEDNISEITSKVENLKNR